MAKLSLFAGQDQLNVEVKPIPPEPTPQKRTWQDVLKIGKWRDILNLGWWQDVLEEAQ